MINTLFNPILHESGWGVPRKKVSEEKKKLGQMPAKLFQGIKISFTHFLKILDQ